MTDILTGGEQSQEQPLRLRRTLELMLQNAGDAIRAEAVRVFAGQTSARTAALSPLQIRDAFHAENHEQRVARITQLFEALTPDQSHIDPDVMTAQAVLFHEDRQTFNALQFQRYLEDVRTGTGINHAQTLSLIGFLDSLESRSSDAESRYRLHLLLDFISNAMERIQADESAEELQGTATGISGFFRDIDRYSHHMSQHGSNYLIRRRFQDIHELSNQEVLDKPDALPGVAGASTDASIYAYRHVLTHYRLRTQTGFYEKHPLLHPVFPIAPGYAAQYEDGQMRQIFRITDASADTAEANAIAQSDPAYDYIYDQLQRETAAFARNRRMKNGSLAVIRTLHTFLRTLKENHATFIFDMSRLDTDALHPLVLGEIVNYNIEQLTGRAAGRLPAPVPETDLSQMLYPEGEEHADDIYRWKMLISLSVRRKVEQDFGIAIDAYELWIQRAFLAYLETVSASDIPAVRAFLSDGDVRSRLIVLTAGSNDAGHARMALQIADMPQSDAVFAAYADIVQHSTLNAQQLAMKARTIDSDSRLKAADFFRGLIRRANDALRQAYGHTFYGEELAQSDVAGLLAELRSEGAMQATARSFFMSQTDLLEGKQNVSLKECRDVQAFIAKAFESADVKRVLLRGLQQQKKLAHIPEIFWEVDRPGGHYTRRLGFDLRAFLATFCGTGQRKTLVEFGPGNGEFARERAADPAVAERYTDLGICNKVYYPLTPLIGRLIDWEALERATGQTVLPEDRHMLADFLYKVTVLQPRTTHFKHLVYDQTVQRDLDRDAALLTRHLIAKAPLLAHTQYVPSVTCGRDAEGNVYYPHHINRPDSGAFEAACQAIAAQPLTFIRTDADVYELIPAYPAGVMISDFTNIAHLQNRQIDVAFGVRSTVYVRGRQYVQFMTDMSRKLTDDGFYIDDNVRDNDGWYYRIAELLEVRTQIDPAMRIMIVQGPALEKEDHLQTAEGVPLAVIMTKDPAKVAYVEQQLAAAGTDPRTGAGYRLVDLEYLSTRSDYLHTLDRTGRVATATQAARSRLGLA